MPLDQLNVLCAQLVPLILKQEALALSPVFHVPRELSVQQGLPFVNQPVLLGHIVARGGQTVSLALLGFTTPLLVPPPPPLAWLVLSALIVPILGPQVFLNACLFLQGLGAR